MRAAFIGTNSLTLSTAELLLDTGHEVVIIERDRNRIDALTERLDALPESTDRLEPGDELILVGDRGVLDQLDEHWGRADHHV